MEIEYNTVYEFDFTNKVKFDTLPINLLYQLFRDGRVASKFIENIIPTWFPDLEFVDAHGFDHVHKTTGRRFDTKSFTESGGCYAPSVMTGAGRKINKEVLHEHARQIDYIFTDITSFPLVKLIFVNGSDLVEVFPSGRIPFGKKHILFEVS